jgi:hypothetical protein
VGVADTQGTSDAEPRPLTAAERSLLDGFLAHDFPGVDALRGQAQSVLAKRGCQCGRGTVDLLPVGDDPTRSLARSPVPVEGRILASDGTDIGGLILFAAGGLLSSLEVYSYSDPLPLPPADAVRWQ